MVYLIKSFHQKFANDYLISSSGLGKIYSLNYKKFIIDIGPWTRGITIGPNNIYIGKSGFGKRKQRHSRYYNGEVFILDRISFNIKKKIRSEKV